MAKTKTPTKQAPIVAEQTHIERAEKFSAFIKKLADSSTMEFALDIMHYLETTNSVSSYVYAGSQNIKSALDGFFSKDNPMAEGDAKKYEGAAKKYIQEL